MPKEDWETNTIDKILQKHEAWPWPTHQFKRPDGILDVACGLSLKGQYIERTGALVGVDVYRPYLEAVKTDKSWVGVCVDVRELDAVFLPKSFDLVLLLDIVEHVEKKEALQLIAAAEKLARVAVVIETPNGFIPQNIDIQGHGGHEWQTHRCGWTPEELQGMGYKTFVRPYRMCDVKRHTEIDVQPDIELIDAIKRVDHG